MRISCDYDQYILISSWKGQARATPRSISHGKKPPFPRVNDPFCLPLQPGTPCADLRAFASVAIDRPNHCSAPTPAKPPERHHSEKALLRWLREAKNQNDRGRLVHVFKQGIRAGWLEKLSSEDILRCA